MDDRARWATSAVNWTPGNLSDAAWSLTRSPVVVCPARPAAPALTPAQSQHREQRVVPTAQGVDEVVGESCECGMHQHKIEHRTCPSRPKTPARQPSVDRTRRPESRSFRDVFPAASQRDRRCYESRPGPLRDGSPLTGAQERTRSDQIIRSCPDEKPVLCGTMIVVVA